MMNCTHPAHEKRDEVDACTCRPNHDCATTMAGLFDVVMRNSLAFATAALGPCAPCTCAPAHHCNCGSADSATAATKRTVRSQLFSAPRADIQRRVTLETPLSTGCIFLPQERITLQPSGGRDAQQHPLAVLHANEPNFRIEVDATGLPGAVYFGTVRVQSVDNSLDKTVAVYVEL